MDDTFFWFFITLVFLFCGWKVLEGIRVPKKLLEWPFLAAVMWLYFFGYMAYDAKTNLGNFLADTEGVGILVPLLCFGGLILGWRAGNKKTKKIHAERFEPTLGFVWLAGIAFVIIGAVGGSSVANAARSGTFDWENTSAYWYLLFYVGYPGLSLAVWAASKWPRPLRFWVWVATLVFLGLFLFPHLNNARRGPTFPAAIILLLVPAMTLRKPPKPWVFISTLFLTGLVMLAFVPARLIVYKGGTWSEALDAFSFKVTVSERGKKLSDNEFINSSHTIGTVAENGKYQYGTGHLGLLLHWIPRSVYKNKPILGEGYYPFAELYEDIEKRVGVRLLGFGASNAGVAGSFVQYGWLCPLFWFGLSWGLARCYSKAIFGRNPRWLMAYVGFMCATHWLVSQSFSAAFVPAMFFQAVPFLVLKLCPRKNLTGEYERRIELTNARGCRRNRCRGGEATRDSVVT